MKTIVVTCLAVLIFSAVVLAKDAKTEEVKKTEKAENKPQVVYIEYKTAEEAEAAQKKILEQYDALGGATVVTDEGAPPVLSIDGKKEEPKKE